MHNAQIPATQEQARALRWDGFQTTSAEALAGLRIESTQVGTFNRTICGASAIRTAGSDHEPSKEPEGVK